jgi:class 3 adenylate cyclase
MIRAAWERISALGIGAEPVGERRRARLTNQSAVIGAVSIGSFGVGYAFAGPYFRVPFITNLVAVGVLLLALVLSARGARTLSKIAVLLPSNVTVVVASTVVGERVGFVYYFFLFAAVAFLLFEDQPWFKFGFALLSAASCLYVQTLPQRPEAAAIVSPELSEILDMTSALVVIATVMFIVHLFTRDTTLAEAGLAAENARSEALLLNILPVQISTRLKGQDKVIADGFADVTVLFADIVGFTELSQELSPERLVQMLNHIFSAFDDLAGRLGLEKIKTIGDCYMVAAGLPEVRVDHVEAVARMGLGMRSELERVNRLTGQSLRIRIGIHTGPVVAGVIGKSKWIYDLWGDTVNTASRMESSGVAEQIQVTQAVHERLVGKFEMEPRGTIKVKGKGEMQTYLLKGEIQGVASLPSRGAPT